MVRRGRCAQVTRYRKATPGKIRFVCSRITRRETKATVAALHTAVTKKYVNPRAIQSYALAFDQVTQQPREELDDFLSWLQRIVRLGFPNSAENEPD